jgi:prepilin-type N-terminal cleavage/methylation domain-containing protein
LGRLAGRAGRGGFSLVELLIVVALMVVMYVMLLSPSAHSYQMRQISACAGNLQNIYVALKTYSIDANGGLPAVTNAAASEAPLSLLIPRYTTGTAYFICPGCGDAKLPDAKPFADRRISYAYYMGRGLGDGADQPLLSDRQVNTLSKAPGDPIFSADGRKPGANHNKYGGNVMFCDGGTRMSKPASEFALTNGPAVILLNPKP